MYRGVSGAAYLDKLTMIDDVFGIANQKNGPLPQLVDSKISNRVGLIATVDRDEFERSRTPAKN